MTSSAEHGQLLALKARVKALEDLGLLAITPAGLALIDDATASAQRTTLGLGSAATKELTSFVAYTPTFTGFGTVSAVSWWSARAGDRLIGFGKFTVGTPTAVEARITLGSNGTNANVNSDATKIASLQLCGLAVRDAASAVSYSMLIESNVGYMTMGFSAAGGAGLAKATGSGLFGAGQVVSANFSVPISGW